SCLALYSFPAPPPSELFTLSLHDALPILMLGYLTDLVTVSLTDGTITDIPGVPDMRVELRQIGGLLLIDPQNLINGIFDALLPRSEEHTSELQSRFDLVCRLLLEKKKKKK